MLYGTLRQRNPAYDAGLIEKLGDLYTGGFAILDKAAKYLHKPVYEHDTSFNDRLKCASYIPYFGQIVDQLASGLFSQELSIVPATDEDDPSTPGGPAVDGFYEEFSENADNKGSSFSVVLKEATKRALVWRSGLIGVDFPAQDRQLITLAEEDELGAAEAYVYPVTNEELIDWEYDDFGRFVWCILYKRYTKREGPSGSRDKIYEEFKVWEMVGGFATWTLYQLIRKPEDKVQDDTSVPEIGAGVTTFREIPLFDLRLSDGLWVGNKIGPMALEHFQTRTSVKSAESKSLVAIPYIALGPEIGGVNMPLPSEVQTDPHRGRDPVGQFTKQGFVLLGAGDKLAFAEPTGATYKLSEDELKNLKDEMFRVTHLMAASISNSSASLGRSGLSKQQDRADTAIVLGALSEDVRKTAVNIYTCISKARGEDVVWRTHGLDSYDVVDRAQVLQEGMSVDAVNIPSPTFKAEYKSRLAMQLEPNLSPETQKVIRDEIVEGVKTESEHADMMKEATVQGMVAAAQEPDGDENKEPQGTQGG